jgi:phage-related protein
MNLKLELDLIYQKVYKLNESLSKEDFDLLSAGFEDGINEGIGKWLGKAAGMISDIPNKIRKGATSVSNKAKDIYKKGKEFAKDAIDKIKNWMSETGEKIKVWISDASKFISDKYDLFVQKIQEAFSSMGKKLVEFWEATKEKSKALWEATKNLFEKISDSIKKGYQSIKDKLSKMGEGISEWVKTNWTKLKEGYENMTDKLGNLYQRALDAIRKGGSSSKKWISIIALKMIITPAKKVGKFFSKIPLLYKEYMGKLRKFINDEIQEFKVGFEEGAKRPWSREKGFINKTKYPDIKVDPEKEIHQGNKVSMKDIDFTLFKPLTHTSAQSEVEIAAENLAKSSEFKAKYTKYSELDLRSELKRKKLTPLAIDWVIYCWEMGKEGETKEITLSSGKKVTTSKKAAMSLPESFKYLKTFEGFKY